MALEIWMSFKKKNFICYWWVSSDRYAMVQVMAWCHQATSHYLSQCWPDLDPCHHMASLGHNEWTHVITLYIGDLCHYWLRHPICLVRGPKIFHDSILVMLLCQGPIVLKIHHMKGLSQDKTHMNTEALFHELVIRSWKRLYDGNSANIWAELFDIFSLLM